MRFSKILLRIIVVSTILTMSCMMTYSGTQDIKCKDTEESYTIVEAVDWNSLQQDASRWLFLRYVFPEGMLENMSTKALVQSLCDYPLLIGLGAMANSYQVDYVTSFAENSELVQELKSRADRKACIEAVRATIYEEGNDENIQYFVLLKLLDYAYA